MCYNRCLGSPALVVPSLVQLRKVAQHLLQTLLQYPLGLVNLLGSPSTGIFSVSHELAFGICLFNSTATPLFGGHLLPATKDNVELALTAVAHSMEPCRGNGAEATCLETCLSMAPDPGCTRLCSSDRAQAVYFLGDGGWEAEPLIAMAEAKAGQCVIHSINFFSEGGGLERIAHITGGTYKEIKSPADIDC